jgi:hypothetical protein
MKYALAHAVKYPISDACAGKLLQSPFSDCAVAAWDFASGMRRHANAFFFGADRARGAGNSFTALMFTRPGASDRVQPNYVCVAINGVAISAGDVSRGWRCRHVNKRITLAVRIGAFDNSYVPHSSKHRAPMHHLLTSSRTDELTSTTSMRTPLKLSGSVVTRSFVGLPILSAASH